MTGIPSQDWLPLLAASIVLIVGNAITYLNDWVIYTSILFAPFAVAAFGVVRYLLYGSPKPAPLADS